MKKYLLLITFFSPMIFAEGNNPLPDVCQKLIAKSEEAFLVVEKHEPDRMPEIAQKRKILSQMKREWDKLQKIEFKPNATEEEKKAVIVLKEEGERQFIANCEKNLQIVEKELQ